MRGFGMMRYAFQFWAFLIVWCGGAWAQDTDVTLTSKQGGMVIRGTVLDYDGRYISLDSDAGPIVFDATLFDCQGRLCPTLRPTQENVTLTVPQGLSLIALPALIENFALRRAYSLKQIPQTDGLQRYELTSNADSDRKFEITLITANSETAIENLVNQSADWAIAFRELTATELAKLRDPSVSSIRSSVKSAVVALDALVPVVAPPNDLSEIHLSNLIDQIRSTSPANISTMGRGSGGRVMIKSGMTGPWGMWSIPCTKIRTTGPCAIFQPVWVAGRRPDRRLWTYAATVKSQH